MPLLDNIEFLNRGNGTTFIDVANGDAAGTNVNTPVATTGDGSESGMTYNGTDNYTTMPALFSYSFLSSGAWTLAVRANFTAETTNDAAISFGPSGGNAWRLWLGVNGEDIPKARIRNGSLTNLDVTGSLTITSGTEIVLVLVAKDKLDDGDFTNGTIQLYDASGTLLGSGDYDLTTLTGFAKHTVGADVTSSYGGGISGDVFWTSAWSRALSVAEIQSLDDSAYPFTTGLTIDSTDATMQRNTDFQVVCSTPSTTPTTGNTTLSVGGDTLTCSAVTGAGPYTLTFPVGDLTKQVDAVGYDWTLAVDLETATTGNIPLAIQAGYTKVDLVDPVTTNASLLFGVTGDTPVTGDHLEYDVTSTLDSGVTLGVAATGVWTVTETTEGDWVTDITVDRRVVQADGTIGTTAALTLSASTGSGGIVTAVVSPMVSNLVSSMVN